MWENMSSNRLSRLMKNYLYIFLLLFLFTNCSDTEINENGESLLSPNGGSGVFVNFGTRSEGWDIDKDYEESLAAIGDEEGPNEEKPYIIDHFEDGDILFISQLGTTVDPTLENIQTNENNKPNYDKFTIKKNLYIYQYKTPESPTDWTEGSNFVPFINTQKNDSTPMNWSYIKNLGSVGNAFSFFALFQGNNQTPNFRTVTFMNYAGDEAEYAPHSAEELGKRYGLFGAYHATSSLYTRMRFRMYPLFNLIRVTLLIPAQEDNDDEPGYSGFAANAFMNNWYAGNNSAQRYPGVWFGVPQWAVETTAALSSIGINTSFKINWRASRSSDKDAPLIQSGNENTNVSFYLLRYDKDDPYAEHPVFRLDNVKRFFPNYVNENHPDEDYDMVRRYEWIAYYVPQSKFNSSAFNALLSIRLLTPGSSGNLYYRESSNSQYVGKKFSVEGTYVPYFFYGTNKGQHQTTQTDLGLSTQGTYTHLTLYVPRKGNQTVMVSAKVMPWMETFTDMTIVEREE